MWKNCSKDCLTQYILFLDLSLIECQTEADIAFLLDGSGSVSSQDFRRMKDFVKNLVRSFSQRDTRVKDCISTVT